MGAAAARRPLPHNRPLRPVHGGSIGYVGTPRTSCLRACQTVWVAGEPGFDRMGEERATQSRIDRRMEDLQALRA
jgi:hypothetical protein